MSNEEKILQLANGLMKLRNNPILVLNLKEIEGHTCFKIQEVLLGKKFKALDVIIQTPGGDIDAAFNNVKLLRNSSKLINMIIPLYSKSAGTLMCIAGDSIIMTTLAELGPLDTQIREEQEGGSPTYRSALNGFKALEQVQLHTLETMDIAAKLILQRSGMKISEAVTLATKFSGSTSGTLYQQLDPTKIGEYARALEIGERYGIMILTRYLNWVADKADAVIKALVKSYPGHGFVIDCDELCLLGFPAKFANEQEEGILNEMGRVLLKTKGNIIKLIEQKKKTSQKPNTKRIKGTK